MFVSKHSNVVNTSSCNEEAETKQDYRSSLQSHMISSAENYFMRCFC